MADVNDPIQAQAKIDKYLKLLDEMRRARPDIFRPIEERFRNDLDYHGEISTDDLSISRQSTITG